MENKLGKKFTEKAIILAYNTPYNEADLEEMYWHGVFSTLKQLKEDCIAYPINSVATPALTEKDLDAILRRLEIGVDDEETGS